MYEAKLYNFIDSNHFEKFRDVVVHISKIDPSFPFFQFNSESLVMMFRSEDRNNLHRRLTWLVKKADKSKTLIYDMVEKHETTA